MIRKEFNKEVLKIRKMVGKGVTFGDELDKIARKKFPKLYFGIFSQDTIPQKLPTKCYFIVNVDFRSQSGSHWLGCYKSGSKVWVFDTFARPSKKLVPFLHKQFTNKKVVVIDTDSKKDQKPSQDDCGARVISFFSMIKKFGIRKTVKIL